jgi:hypothetical protein
VQKSVVMDLPSWKLLYQRAGKETSTVQAVIVNGGLCNIFHNATIRKNSDCISKRLKDHARQKGPGMHALLR